MPLVAYMSLAYGDCRGASSPDVVLTRSSFSPASVRCRHRRRYHPDSVCLVLRTEPRAPVATGAPPRIRWTGSSPDVVTGRAGASYMSKGPAGAGDPHASTWARGEECNGAHMYLDPDHDRWLLSHIPGGFTYVAHATLPGRAPAYTPASPG